MQRTTKTVVATTLCAAAALSACGAQATMSDFVKGTWSCANDRLTGSAPATVEVGGGTFSMKTESRTTSGTWDASLGGLSVKIDGQDYYGVTGGQLKEFPAKSKPQGSFSSSWTSTYSPTETDAGPLDVSIDGNKVRLVYADANGAGRSTTTCTKK